MDKHKLMGQRVKVTCVLERKTRRNIVNRYKTQYVHDLIPSPLEADGWVVGFRSIPIFEIDYEDGQPMPICSGGIHVMLVSLSPFTKPVYVPLDGFEQATTPEAS